MSSLTTLDGKNQVSLKLISKTSISDDTRLFRFALPSEKHSLGLPLGSCIVAFAKDEENNDEIFKRPYTPVSSNRDLGYMDLIIKIYFPNIHPDFPKGGKMGMVFENLKIGESLNFWGPGGFVNHQIHENGVDMSYHQNKSKTEENYVERKNVNHIGMIAGGSGITPMLQLIRELFAAENSNNETTKMTLIFSNKTKNDILCKEEIDQLVEKSNGRFKTIYALSREQWKEDEKLMGHQDIIKVNGRVDKNMIEKYMPKHEEEGSSILLCGPPAMVKEACQKNLEDIGWDMKKVFVY